MGQCGCGDFRSDRAFKLADGTVLVFDVYRGCAECFSGPAINLWLFDGSSNPFLQGVQTAKAVTADEFGGDRGNGLLLAFPLFDVKDLQAEAAELAVDLSEYANLENVLADVGLDLIQGAIRRCEERHRPVKRARK